MALKEWDIEITDDSKQPIVNLKEIFRYKDLLFLFVRRDFVSLYKQTILGPIWVIIQPVLTTITFTIVFNKIANIDTVVPPVLFYLIGITVWNYFADNVTKTSETFVANQSIFGKVYFPRLIVPLSIVVTNMFKFFIQLLLFLIVYLYFVVSTDENFAVSWHLVLIPVLIFIMAALGLGIGLIIAALTTKYRDLRFLIQFGITLVMYATPIVYPLSMISEEYRWVLVLNPMTSIVETFKVGFFGAEFGIFEWNYLGYSCIFSLLTLALGIRLFGKMERSFMDTI